jgi:rhomboid protease GluP
LELWRRATHPRAELNQGLLDHAAQPAEPEAGRVGVWPDFSAAHEHALVVLAMGVECWIEEVDGGFGAFAPREDLAAIAAELALYAAEQSERRQPAELPMACGGLGLTLVWLAALLAAFLRQHADADFTRRFSNSNYAVLEHGEWWRPFTALFLHADAAHLLGNALMGGLMCVWVVDALGALRGWLLILAAGTLGNALTGWLYFPEPHDSIGASTATFGALGILVGLGTYQAWLARSCRELRPLLVPVAVGLMVLGLWGTSGERTDVAGHLFGWLAGLLLGLAAAVWRGDAHRGA